MTKLPTIRDNNKNVALKIGLEISIKLMLLQIPMGVRMIIK